MRVNSVENFIDTERPGPGVICAQIVNDYMFKTSFGYVAEIAFISFDTKHFHFMWLVRSSLFFFSGHITQHRPKVSYRDFYHKIKKQDLIRQTIQPAAQKQIAKKNSVIRNSVLLSTLMKLVIFDLIAKDWN